MKNRITKIAALLLAVIMVFTGCAQVDVNMKLNSNGTGNAEMLITINKSQANEALKKMGATDSQINDFWREYQNQLKENTASSNITYSEEVIDGKSYIKLQNKQTLRKGKLTVDYGAGPNSYLSTETVYQLIKPETVDSAADLSAVNTDDIEMNITFTFPKEIVSTNGTLSADKKTVSYKVALDKTIELFATTNKNETMASVKAKIKKANTIANTKITKTKVKKTSAKAKTTSATIKFKKVSDAVSYEVQCSTSKKFTKAKTLTTKKTSYTVKKLKKGKKYYVRVRAKKLNLIEEDVYSKWVKKSFKIKANKKAKK